MVYAFVIVSICLGIIIFQMTTNTFGNSKVRAQYFDPETTLYSINDGNQTSLVCAAEIKEEWLADLKEAYNWNHFDEYDNILTEYIDFLFDDVVEGCGITEQEDLWNAMNRPQKVLWAFLAFTGDVDSGGLYQFLFNSPQFIFSAYEMFEELGLDRLKEDYKLVLDELIGKQARIKELKEALREGDEQFESRWNAFAAGYESINTSQVIESYYYRSYFKKELFEKIANYIEANLDHFAVVE